MNENADSMLKIEAGDGGEKLARLRKTGMEMDDFGRKRDLKKRTVYEERER